MSCYIGRFTDRQALREIANLRRFIRHPTDIPIEVSVSAKGDAKAVLDRRPGLDVSVGGLAFHVVCALEPGSLVSVRIASVQPMFETVARVVWCRRNFADFTVGAEFVLSDDEYRVRMVEQVCHIESYRRQIFQEERRELSADEAAMEWISKYAAQFPREHSDDM